MRMFKNMMWMFSGVGVGFLASKYSKDISKLMKKGKKEIDKTINNM